MALLKCLLHATAGSSCYAPAESSEGPEEFPAETRSIDSSCVTSGFTRPPGVTVELSGRLDVFCDLDALIVTPFVSDCVVFMGDDFLGLADVSFFVRPDVLVVTPAVILVGEGPSAAVDRLSPGQFPGDEDALTSSFASVVSIPSGPKPGSYALPGACSSKTLRRCLVVSAEELLSVVLTLVALSSMRRASRSTMTAHRQIMPATMITMARQPTGKNHTLFQSYT